MHGTGPRVWNALIRTHHITSRKKVAKLRQAATANDVFVLLRSGGSPGIMYVEGGQRPVEDWVAAVHVSERLRADENDLLTISQNLRYKDYQLVTRPNETNRERDTKELHLRPPGLYETDSVKDFGDQMQQRGVFAWWRKGMVYADQPERL